MLERNGWSINLLRKTIHIQCIPSFVAIGLAVFEFITAKKKYKPTSYFILIEDVAVGYKYQYLSAISYLLT